MLFASKQPNQPSSPSVVMKTGARGTAVHLVCSEAYTTRSCNLHDIADGDAGETVTVGREVRKVIEGVRW